MSNELVNIRVYDDKILLQQRNEQNILTSRTVSPDNLAQAFSMNVKFDTGFLPCYEGIVRYVKNNNKVLLVYQMPEKQREVKYRDSNVVKTFQKVVTPWTLYIAMLQANNEGEYSVISEYCYAMKGPLLSGLDSLYRFPFTNVYDDARICWGDNRARYTWKNLAGLISHIDLFYGSPFNAHLDGENYRPYKVTSGGREATLTTVVSLIQALEGKEAFPREILKNPVSFKSVTDRLIEIM